MTYPQQPQRQAPSDEAIEWAEFFYSLYRQKKSAERRGDSTKQNALHSTPQSTALAAPPKPISALVLEQATAFPEPRPSHMHKEGSRRKTYHLSTEERRKIRTLKDKGYTLRTISRTLKRSVSTISDELRRSNAQAE
jgi:hypothetical protein